MSKARRAVVAIVLTNILIIVTNLLLFPIIGWWDLAVDAIPIAWQIFYLLGLVEGVGE